MADSATPPALADTPTPNALFVARMGRVDGCPECLGNYTPPRAVLDLSDPEMSGFVAAYHCEDCGHYWITSWGDN